MPEPIVDIECPETVLDKGFAPISRQLFDQPRGNILPLSAQGAETHTLEQREHSLTG